MTKMAIPSEAVRAWNDTLQHWWSWVIAAEVIVDVVLEVFVLLVAFFHRWLFNKKAIFSGKTLLRQSLQFLLSVTHP